MTSGSGLQAGLKNRHLTMIAIGGVIGAGLFVGSSSGIATGCGRGRQVPHWTASSTTRASTRRRDSERLTCNR